MQGRECIPASESQQHHRQPSSRRGSRLVPAEEGDLPPANHRPGETRQAADQQGAQCDGHRGRLREPAGVWSGNGPVRGLARPKAAPACRPTPILAQVASCDGTTHWGAQPAWKQRLHRQGPSNGRGGDSLQSRRGLWLFPGHGALRANTPPLNSGGCCEPHCGGPGAGVERGAEGL